MQEKKIVADEMLEQAYSIMAAVICDHGDKYLPVFKRLHEEREARKAKHGLRNIALQVARSSE